uniref:Uncharacterized protein n=1 Tax=Magallana gigas TaxID=29159 RepID=K1QCL2_MAGGI
MCPPNKSRIQWLPVSSQYYTNWRYSPYLKSGAAKRGTRLMSLPDPLLTTTPKPACMQILYIDTRDLTESGAASVSSGA